MYIIEHALLNLGKNKSRNILLSVIIFAIIASTVIAFAIFNSTGVIMDETRMALQCAVRIAPQRQTPGSGGAVTAGGSQQAAMLSMEQYQSFAESEYLDGADIKQGGRSADGVDAVYFLKRPGLLIEFESELRSKGLPDEYSVNTDESAFETVVEPIESLNKLALTFLVIILILGAAIMTLMSIIAIRERKYEIGVLRAMGMKKKKVAFGLWTEIIVITCICFALGIGAGAALSQPVSDTILADHTVSVDERSSTLSDRLNAEAGVAEKSVEVNISVNGITALEIFAVSILLASITGVISVKRITKYEPIKILMERN